MRATLSLLACVALTTALPYEDASLPIPARVADLIARMTLPELIGQTWSPYGGMSQDDLLLFCGNASLGSTTINTISGGTPAERLAGRNTFQANCQAANRLHIPISFSQEGLHSGAVGGTVFPESLLTACTWNESLVSRIGAALAFEARGAGVVR